MRTRRLPRLVEERLTQGAAGVVSVCTSHPLAIEAALLAAASAGRPALIEATCNQVNQDGGYTGMTPSDFRALVESIARRVKFEPEKIIFGGDHLGPNPWRRLPAEQAMERAKTMVAAYARAGFSKIHLDASMGCAGEPVAVSDAIAAERAAQLAEVAEAADPSGSLCYVVGTEVPAPGGVGDKLHVEVTRPASARATIEAHRHAFQKRGLNAAFARAIALVVQPGVEFGASGIVEYERAKAVELSALLDGYPQIVFEAHSTDYQPAEALSALVADGFAILKVGPALTFALREALYGLDHIAEVMFPDDDRVSLRAVMDKVMVEGPSHWRDYYGADARQQSVSRHFSLSDRIRYYWPKAEASAAVQRLFSQFEGVEVPPPLIAQHLGGLSRGPACDPKLSARGLVLSAIGRAVRPYYDACADISTSASH